MPSQLFRITRAPEAEPIDPDMLRRLLWRARSDSEWQVTDIDALEAMLKKAQDEKARKEGSSENHKKAVS